MKWLKTFGAFWYDFIVGDDWTIALGVVLAVGATAIVHATGVAAWPIVPISVALMLTTSVWRARPSRPVPDGNPVSRTRHRHSGASANSPDLDNQTSG
jgi:hypothetical protein